MKKRIIVSGILLSMMAIWGGCNQSAEIVVKPS